MCSLKKNKLLLYFTRHSWMKKLTVLKWAATACDPSQRTQLSPANSHLPLVKFRDPDCRWQDTWAKSKPVHGAGFKAMVDLSCVTAAWQDIICLIWTTGTGSMNLLHLSQLQSEASYLEFRLRKSQLHSLTARGEAQGTQAQLGDTLFLMIMDLSGSLLWT